jgi:protoporphyrinogen oxidase
LLLRQIFSYMAKKAIIIGAGPAGLTAAYELLKRTDVIPIVLEKSGFIGGISRTTNYKGNRMDMGPHRFFSKSDRVMDWWLSIMPLERKDGVVAKISYQNKSRQINPENSVTGDSDKVMLLIRRLTRIYFLRKFFAYPIQLSIDTLRTLGLIRTVKIMISFLYIRLFPIKPERSLEDFIINKFGNQLYLLFFKDYTEKVWGIAPSEISAEWGAQRIKGVSLSKAIASAIKNPRKKKKEEIGQKGTETSLIEQFLYPKYGPGSLWEEIARQVEERGGKVYLHQDVQKIYVHEGKIQSVNTINSQTGQTGAWEGDYFFSTMPVQELIAAMGEEVPDSVREVAAGLQYRDFINVGILLKQMSTKEGNQLELKDNWIYIQERDVKVGRLMVYNNWGGGMIKDPNTIWIGMEYFCNKTDALWAQSDEAIQRLAIDELVKMDLARAEDVLDSTVQRMEKTYPAYFGTYDRFDVIRNYTDQFENLFLIGRNGMHKYNNSDHSSLCAMVAVDNIVAGVTSKANLWAINTEQEYHEEKKTETVAEQKEAIREPAMPFLVDYLWKNKTNRGWWIAGFLIFLLQFIIFKFKYPYANYMPDSYSYLEAAASNADVNMWPVAYSKFLRLISVFTHSDKVVVGLQYLFLQTSSLFFLFSLLYFQKVGRWLKGALLLFVILDPITLYIANYISADALFIGFSLLWLSTLVWIVYRPKGWMIVMHGLLLLACFTLRYNAIYYPIVSILVFVLSRRSWKFKLTGIATGVGLVLVSFLFTSQKMGTVTGRRQFSAFGGWQLANNALYMYEQIPAKERTPVPARFAKLEAMVREHMDTLQKVKRSHEDSVNSYFYLWSPKAPLVTYLEKEYKKDSTTPYFKRWASEAPFYADYGLYLIKKYPLEYAENWMLPNAVKFAVPPTEFLGTYNMGGDSVGKLAKDWFNYKSQKVKDHNKKDAKIAATEWYPVFVTLVNLVFVMGLIGMLVLGAIKRKEYGLPQLLGIALLLWLLNCGFSIFASPIVLRYQTFPMLVFLPLGLLMVERIWKMA